MNAVRPKPNSRRCATSERHTFFQVKGATDKPNGMETGTKNLPSMVKAK